MVKLIDSCFGVIPYRGSMAVNCTTMGKIIKSSKPINKISFSGRQSGRQNAHLATYAYWISRIATKGEGSAAL